MRDLADIIERYLVAKSEGDSAAWAAKLWAIGENQRFAGKVRSQDRLFVTDVGKCHRQVKYRLLGTPRRPPSAAKRLMFEQAEDIETTVAAAMKWEGILLDYQQGVDLSDRENWGGRKDVTITDPLTIEVKSARSNSFRGYRSDDMPKPAHETQAFIYWHYDGILACELYIDRGGANPPQQFATPMLDWQPIADEMDELDRVREDAYLPDILPQVLKRESVRKSRIDLGGLVIDWSGEVWLKNDWRCGYCDYDDCPAKRRESHLLCKMTKKDPMTLTSEGRRHEGDVYEYLRAGQKEMPLHTHAGIHV